MKRLFNNPNMISLVDQAMLSGSNFLTGICIARFSGIEAFGEYALLLLYLMLALSIQHAFIISPMQQLASTTGQFRAGYLKQVHVLQSLFSLLSASFISLLFRKLTPIAHVEAWIIFLFVFFSLYYETNRKSMYVHQQNKRILFTSFIGNIIPLTLIALISLYQGLYLNEVLIIQAFFYALSLTIGSYSFLFQPHSISYLTLIGLHIKESAWLTATSLLQWFAGNLFMVAANQILGSAALGAIKMAQNLIGLINVILLSLENHFPTKIAELVLQNNPTQLRSFIKRFYQQYLLLSVGLLMVLLVFTETIVWHLFGEQFMAYTHVVYGFILMYVLVVAITPLRIIVRVIQQQHIIFCGYLLSTLFAFFWADVMVRNHGITGVIIGLTISQFMMAITYVWGFKQARIINLRNSSFI